MVYPREYHAPFLKSLFSMARMDRFPRLAQEMACLTLLLSSQTSLNATRVESFLPKLNSLVHVVLRLLLSYIFERKDEPYSKGSGTGSTVILHRRFKESISGGEQANSFFSWQPVFCKRL